MDQPIEQTKTARQRASAAYYQRHKEEINERKRLNPMSKVYSQRTYAKLTDEQKKARCEKSKQYYHDNREKILDAAYEKRAIKYMNNAANVRTNPPVPPPEPHPESEEETFSDSEGQTTDESSDEELPPVQNFGSNYAVIPDRPLPF